MSVAFVFNASLNDVVPVYPIQSFPVQKNVDTLVVVWCLALLYMLFIFSTRSVVFDFSASLNDFAPLVPIIFPVGKKKKRRVIC